MKKVNVLMCVYMEDIALIKQAIESIIYQTYKNIELIVVIDHPARIDVVALLEKFKSSISVKYILNEENMGLPKSLNIGLEQCDAPLVARMDADDIALPDRIEKQVRFLIRNQCDLVGGYIQLIDENCNIMQNRTNYPVNNAAIKRLLLIKNCIPHPTWIFRRELAIKIQGYRDIYSSEDYDFLIRAMLVDAKLGVLPQICLQYRVNKEGITQNNLALQKILIKKICNQYKNIRIYSLPEFDEYVSNNEKLLQNKRLFYSCIKKRKKNVKDIFTILFSTTFIVEIRERIIEKIIIIYDQYILADHFRR